MASRGCDRTEAGDSMIVFLMVLTVVSPPATVALCAVLLVFKGVGALLRR